MTPSEQEKAKYQAKIDRYETEKNEIKKAAEGLEAEARAFDEKSEAQMHQHHRWAQATMQPLHLIYARAANGVIGKDNTMPWHLPEDMAHFKQLTQGCAVIMGRKTWDSLPPRFRPLPGRTNIVVTRQSDWQAEGALRADSLEGALTLARAATTEPHRPVWVMGGAQIYAQALPLANRVEVTEIAQDFDGDAYAPTLGAEWKEATRSSHVSTNGLPFDFVSYVRG